jgi:hypothetical protein
MDLKNARGGIAVREAAPGDAGFVRHRTTRLQPRGTLGSRRRRRSWRQMSGAANRWTARAVVPARQRSGARRRAARPAQPFAISVSPSGERNLVRAFTRQTSHDTPPRARGPSRFRARRRGGRRWPRASPRQPPPRPSWPTLERMAGGGDEVRAEAAGLTPEARMVATTPWPGAYLGAPSRFRARRRGARHRAANEPLAASAAPVLDDPGASGGGYRRRISPTFRCQGRAIFPPGRLLLARAGR